MKSNTISCIPHANARVRDGVCVCVFVRVCINPMSANTHTKYSHEHSEDAR
jgi:hypothetical protein